MYHRSPRQFSYHPIRSVAWLGTEQFYRLRCKFAAVQKNGHGVVDDLSLFLSLSHLVQDAVDLSGRLLASPLRVALEVAEHDGHVFQVVHHSPAAHQRPDVAQIGVHVLQQVFRFHLGNDDGERQKTTTHEV